MKIEKEVNNSSDDGSNYTTVQQYGLRVGRIAFEDVDEKLLNLIEEGDKYAFNFTKDTREILSCEFISKEK